MKKNLLCLFLLVAGAMNAQIVNIPDANFKNFLLNYQPAIDTNDDGEIQVAEAELVTVLYLYNNTSVDITGIEAFANVTTLGVNLNEDIALDDFSFLTNLEDLSIQSTYLETLDVSSFTNLIKLNISSQVDNLIFGNLPQVRQLGLSGLNGNMVNLSGLQALEKITMGSNLALALDLSGNQNLIYVNSFMSFFASITMGYHPNLTTFVLWDCNSFEHLDLSGCPNLNNFTINAFTNPYDIDMYINLKNGSFQSGGAINGINANHVYICIDEGEEDTLDYDNPNFLFSTYCNFTPGGNYNTITGTVTFDADGNGCTTSDTIFPFTSVQINDGTSSGYSSMMNGNYNFYTQAGTFTLTPQFENNYFTASPATITIADNNNNTVTQNFCVTANGLHNDAEVTLVPLSAARPGFDATYKIIYKNKGNQTLNGAVSLTYDDAVLDYVSASPVENSVATGSLSWNYSSLLPFESREILLTLNVNSPMETPAVNIDDALNFDVTITPVNGDETPDDNAFALKQIVVGSYDPNDITCLEGAAVDVDKIGDYLHYNINFENTGTYPASFVVVKDIIDETKFDVSSLVVLNASHAVETRVTGNKVEFYFGDINLAANGGKGNVTFKIKSLETLAVNSSVMQKADIFFDYNWPIVTNEAFTTYALLNAPGFTKDTSVKIFPNPATNVISISADSAIQSMQLFDVQGRLLEATSVNDISATLDISSRANGIYFIKIATDKGVNVEKLVKE